MGRVEPLILWEWSTSPPDLNISAQDLLSISDNLPCPQILCGDFNAHSPTWRSTCHNNTQLIPSCWLTPTSSYSTITSHPLIFLLQMAPFPQLIFHSVPLPFSLLSPGKLTLIFVIAITTQSLLHTLHHNLPLPNHPQVKSQQSWLASFLPSHFKNRIPHFLKFYRTRHHLLHRFHYSSRWTNHPQNSISINQQTCSLVVTWSKKCSSRSQQSF